ncbi:MAG: cbb3-type cytochrome oxidase assembly protein CcoS [Proteobacteria bacterium]|nr:cbb3-type cytochrome oxidase assembly protein CcoS [Pseudomonadota bacterium]
MYYPFFLTYILTGLIIGLLVFFWALKNGQFSDQQRARFLALEEDNQAVVTNSKRKYEVYVILFLIVAGIASSAAIIVYALVSH